MARRSRATSRPSSWRRIWRTPRRASPRSACRSGRRRHRWRPPPSPRSTRPSSGPSRTGGFSTCASRRTASPTPKVTHRRPCHLVSPPAHIWHAHAHAHTRPHTHTHATAHAHARPHTPTAHAHARPHAPERTHTHNHRTGIKVRPVKGVEAVTYLDPGALTAPLSYVSVPLPRPVGVGAGKWP